MIKKEAKKINLDINVLFLRSEVSRMINSIDLMTANVRILLMAGADSAKYVIGLKYWQLQGMDACLGYQLQMLVTFSYVYFLE